MMESDNKKFYSTCVCCGAPIPDEMGTMVCDTCRESLAPRPASKRIIHEKAGNRKFRKEFTRVRKAMSKTSCAGGRSIKICVDAAVVEDIIERLRNDGFRAAQTGIYYDSPLFVAW